MTKKQQEVIEALVRGARVWRYSRSGVGSICEGSNVIPVRKAVLDALEGMGVIEEDEKHSFYRAESGSDIVYRLTESTRKAFSVRIDYTYNLSAHGFMALKGYAEELGYNVSQPVSEWAPRILREMGTDVMTRALEWKSNQDKEQNEQRTEESAR